MTLSMQPCQSVSGGGTAYTQKNCIYDSATGQEQEIITMESGGPMGNNIFCTKAPTTAPGLAFVQKCYTRNMQGDFYSISGSGGMPHQINNPDGGVIGKPVTSADPQDIEYLEDIQPGATSRKKYDTFVAPWWYPVFGLRQDSAPAWLSFSAEGGEAIRALIGYGIVIGVGVLVIRTIGDVQSNISSFDNLSWDD